MSEPIAFQGQAAYVKSKRFAITTTASVVIIFIVGLWAYWNSFEGKFLFDDEFAIETNPTIRNLRDIGQVLSPPNTGYPVDSRPVVNLSLAINYALSGSTSKLHSCFVHVLDMLHFWGHHAAEPKTLDETAAPPGLDVWGYHAVNLGAHMLAALMLFGVLRRTLMLPVFPERYTGLSLVTALVWLVHPLQTESVTYVSQRAESLLGIFYLLTMYASIRAFRSARPTGWYVLAIASCLVGMATKEVMASVPVVVLVYDRMFVSASWREIFQKRWRLYAGLAATWGLLALLLLRGGFRAGTAGFAKGITPWTYALTQMWAVPHYFRLCFWPSPLILDYGDEAVVGLWQDLPGAIILTFLLVCTVMAYFKKRYALAFLGSWFFVILAPSSSIIPVVTQTAAEHRMYLPLAAVAALVVLGGYWVWVHVLKMLVRSRAVRSALAESVPLAFWACMIVLLGSMTIARNADYHSVLGMWRDVVQKMPGNDRAHNNYSTELYIAGDIPGALAEVSKAIELDANLPAFYHNRSQIEFRLGRLALSAADMEKAVELEPNYINAMYKLAEIYARMGQSDRAIAVSSRIILLQPCDAGAYAFRAHWESAASKFEQAVEDFTRAIQLDSSCAPNYYNRAMARGQLGLYKQAIEDFSMVVHLDPNAVGAYQNRAICLYHLGRYDDAWRDVRSVRALGGAVEEDLLHQLVQVSGRHE